jgi:carbon-monoxide dehydrogenase large subunit
MKFGAGQPVPRLEDDRLITGKGQFTDDLTLPGAAHMVLLRSPHAHAKLREVDTLHARSAPGHRRLHEQGSCGCGHQATPVAVMPNRDGSPMFIPERHALAKERVAHLGEPVAMVVAETAAQARDAAEMIDAHYEELPAVADTVAALTAPPSTPALSRTSRSTTNWVTRPPSMRRSPRPRMSHA